MIEKITTAAEELKKLENVRPIISEKHDLSASFYKNKDSKEPLFHFSAKGAYDIDLTKVAVCAVAALVTVSTVQIAVKLKKAKKNKLKKLKAQLKEEKKALREAKKAL